MPEQNIQNTIIYLIGMPGVGKYTIAKEIFKQADFLLVDNHLINSPIFSLVRKDVNNPIPAGAWEKTRPIFDAVADTLVNISPSEYSFVFTNALIEGLEGHLEIFHEVEAIAEKRRARFMTVRLVINDRKEHEKRITSEVRKERFKTVSKDYIERAYDNNYEVLTPPNDNNYITLDITSLSAQEAAKEILLKL